ncbi:TonB family protein, partial [candidate division KSB1 bacterium]|nr:TonB family protein [candidate division KSB1 bacterium]
HYESVNFLLEKGAKANKKNRRGNSAFMFAVQNGHLDIMQLLIENGADINERNILGYTPLLYALDYHFTEIVKFLIENGADVNAITKNEVTPIKIVKKEKDSVLVAYLLEHGAIDEDSTKTEEDSVKTGVIKEDEVNAAAADSSVILAQENKENEKVPATEIADPQEQGKDESNLEKKEGAKLDEKEITGLDEKENERVAEKETKEKKSQPPETETAKQDSIKEEKKVDLKKLAEEGSVPQPEGGFKKIRQNLKLPRIVQDGEISGTIVINVKVNEKGKIIHTKFVKLLMNKKCNAAALAAIKSVKWLPAKKEGEPITADVDVPIEFKAALMP